jgi:hypothetical protein
MCCSLQQECGWVCEAILRAGSGVEFGEIRAKTPRRGEGGKTDHDLYRFQKESLQRTTVSPLGQGCAVVPRRRQSPPRLDLFPVPKPSHRQLGSEFIAMGQRRVSRAQHSRLCGSSSKQQPSRPSQGTFVVPQPQGFFLRPLVTARVRPSQARMPGHAGT